MHQSHLSLHISSPEKDSHHTRFSSLPTPTMPLSSHILNFLPFHLSSLLFPSSLWCLTALLLPLFPLSAHCALWLCLHCSLAPTHPRPPSAVCVGSGPYSCFNGTSGFKLLCATCHRSVSASHHCQSIPLTLLRSLSQGPAARLGSAHSQQQSCQCL